ncbi:MAG: hypothetical protein DDT38_01243 [Firmicutes bacterium]|nr:hypothetical protein [candidate division NPL-UPA2 bacterium]
MLNATTSYLLNEASGRDPGGAPKEHACSSPVAGQTLRQKDRYADSTLESQQVAPKGQVGTVLAREISQVSQDREWAAGFAVRFFISNGERWSCSLLLKNVTQDIVFEKLGEILRCHPEICPCARCQLDIAAIALNHLQPRYVVSDLGEVITRTGSLDAQISVDTMLELTKAIAIVSRFPRHAENSDHK